MFFHYEEHNARKRRSQRKAKPVLSIMAEADYCFFTNTEGTYKHQKTRRFLTHFWSKTGVYKEKSFQRNISGNALYCNHRRKTNLFQTELHQLMIGICDAIVCASGEIDSVTQKTSG